MKTYISKSILYIGLFGLMTLIPFASAFAQNKEGQTENKIDTVKGPSGKTNRKLKKAAEDYNDLNYVNAVEIYEKVAEKGYTSKEINVRLGNLYYFRAKYQQAAKWYKRLFDKDDSPQDALIYLRYSQCLRAIGEDQQAKRFFDKFQEQQSTTDQAPKSAEDYLDLIRENDGRYQEVKPLEPIYDENQISYGQTVNDHKLIYSTTVDQPKSFLNTKDGWDGLSFMMLYEVEIDSANRAVGSPKKLKGKLKKRFHDASPVFTKDGRTLYFTRSNYNAGKNDRKNKKGLKIYRSKKENGKWQKPKSLSFNDDAFSTAHPALSPDETKLYFASNRKGTLGQTDLYVVDIHGDGTFGEPKNLGNTINTAGRESFPFVSKDSLLYFSSDGHYGLGGLDVFVIDLKKKAEGHIINLGQPINTYADDFAYGIDEHSGYGFVSSDRSPDGDTLVRTNIYRFKQNKPPKDVYTAEIEGYVTDKNTGDSIQGAIVTVTDLTTNEPYAQVKTDDKGYYHVNTDRFSTYTVRAGKNDYEPDEKASEKGETKQRTGLQLQNMTIRPGSDLVKMLNIPRIYFDFDKDAIRNPDATRDLEKVYQLMKKYPGLRLKIRAHTDSRGSKSYNQKLSENRAKSTRNWLIDRGIDADRLEWEGVGESELANGCADGVPCTNEQHQQNRRSDFIIIE